MLPRFERAPFLGRYAGRWRLKSEASPFSSLSSERHQGRIRQGCRTGRPRAQNTSRMRTPRRTNTVDGMPGHWSRQTAPGEYDRSRPTRAPSWILSRALGIGPSVLNRACLLPPQGVSCRVAARLPSHSALLRNLVIIPPALGSKSQLIPTR